MEEGWRKLVDPGRSSSNPDEAPWVPRPLLLSVLGVHLDFHLDSDWFSFA